LGEDRTLAQEREPPRTTGDTSAKSNVAHGTSSEKSGLTGILPDLASGKPVNRRLKPVETLIEQQDISRLHAMPEPESYVVQVPRGSSGGATPWNDEVE
jgi:hypothetical protein